MTPGASCLQTQGTCQADGGCAYAAASNGTPCAGGACLNGACNPCSAGASCDAGVTCKAGSISCGSGSPVCSVAGNASAGTACAGGVCLNGTCNPCSSGASCDAGVTCKTGSIGCGTGAPVCGVSGNAAAGTPCAGGVCLGGSCNPCSAGASCDPGVTCKSGSIGCGTGTPVCSVSGNASNGTSCSGGACLNGSCNPCNAGASCDPGVTCKVGTISCATGSPVCTVSGNAADGLACGGNASTFCQAGACAYTSSCKQIRTYNPSAADGVYHVNSGLIGDRDVYCQMVHVNCHGWTIWPDPAGVRSFPDNLQPFGTSIYICDNSTYANCYALHDGQTPANVYYVYTPPGYSVRRLESNLTWTELGQGANETYTGATLCAGGDSKCVFSQVSQGRCQTDGSQHTTLCNANLP